MTASYHYKKMATAWTKSWLMGVLCIGGRSLHGEGMCGVKSVFEVREHNIQYAVSVVSLTTILANTFRTNHAEYTAEGTESNLPRLVLYDEVEVSC